MKNDLVTRARGMLLASMVIFGTVAIAVRGVDSYFNVERGTYRMVGTDGRNEWIADPNARDCRVTEKLSKAAVGQIIDELICRSPQK